MQKSMLKTGEQYNRLTVIEFSHRIHKVGKTPKNNYYKYYYRCKCKCGNYCIVDESSLKSGNTKSCGCLNRDKRLERNTKHNLSKTRLYKIFHGIKKRCYNPKTKSYNDYGGRGIKICDEWLNDFMSFYEWAINNGYREDLTIERIDVNGDYCPENCKWIPKREQSLNTRKNVYWEYKGEKHLLGEWANLYNLPFTCVRRRLARGWSMEKTLNTPKLRN